jgi:hypothetical protein
MLTVRTETSVYLVDYPKRFLKIGKDTPNTIAPAFQWIECTDMTYPEVGSSMHMAFMHGDKPKLRETTHVLEITDFTAELEEVDA